MQKTNICSKEGEQGRGVHMHEGSEGRKAAQETGRILLYTDNFRRSVTTREYKSGTERNSEETCGRQHMEHLATMKHIANSSSPVSYLISFLSFFHSSKIICESGSR